MSLFDKLRGVREEKRRQVVEDLEDKVLLSEEVRRFFESDVGKHIKSKMESDKLTVLKTIQETDPFHAEEIMKLQCKYSMISNIQSYLGQAIIEGDNAYQALQQTKNRDI